MTVVWYGNNIPVIALLIGAALSVSACTLTQDAAEPSLPSGDVPTGPWQSAWIQDRTLPEISGLAASHRQPGILWAINDSGQPAVLHALDHQGRVLQRWQIAVDNRDWESLDLARIGDEHYLVIADIGDNLARHRDYRLHFIVEPTLDPAASESVPPLQPQHTLHYRYPDGSHNGEAMAVGVEAIYVIDKQHHPGGTRIRNRVYRLPLPDTAAGTIDSHRVAEALGPVELGRRPLGYRMLHWLTGFDLGQPTGFVMSPDDRQAFVLTYRAVLRFQRAQDESWASAFARSPTFLHRHTLRQAEALTLDTRGLLWFTSEGQPAPLWAVPLLSGHAFRQPAPL